MRRDATSASWSQSERGFPTVPVHSCASPRNSVRRDWWHIQQERTPRQVQTNSQWQVVAPRWGSQPVTRSGKSHSQPAPRWMPRSVSRDAYRRPRSNRQIA